MSPRILVADPLAEDGLARLREAAEVEVRTKLPPAELIEAVAGADALIVRSETKVTEAVLEAGRGLRVVGRAGVGVDNIDVTTATRKGILVVNAPRGNIVAAAEHAVGLLFALARNIPQADASVRRGEWQRSKYTGVEIRGKTLGIVGLGNIGSEVAKRAQGLEMEVIAYDPAIAPERAEQFNVELVGLDDVFRRADFVTIHAPLVEGTRNLIDARVLALSRPGLRLVNAARGGIVDETALHRALADGVIAGAASDVFLQEPIGQSPLLTLPNFIATPHIAASTVEAQASVAYDVAEEVLAVLRGELPRYAVNAPSLPPETMALLRPYAVLAERLASLHVQLVSGRVGQLEIEVQGELADQDVSLVTAAAIRGVCQPFTEERINAVNARLVARHRGLRLVERRAPATASGGADPDRLTLRTDGHEMEGTVRAGEPRLTRIGPYRMDLVPEGRFLVSWHEDRPGVIGQIGTILGERDVNIASMQLGRDVPRGMAMMVLTVDDPVGSAVLERLRDVAGMSDLRYVELGSRADG
ncbi:MAG TPA: phosphoglycerate dehydrogenase [Candidatus Dormibacteraeota bacterium]|nr:phosphoglycerate dehydrogenase [Candidatus Dormibacteraeota bacterium]